MEILGLMIKFYSAEELSEEDLIDFGQMETLLLFLENEGSGSDLFISFTGNSSREEED